MSSTQPPAKAAASATAITIRCSMGPRLISTELLACSSCHDRPFEKKSGAAKIDMAAIRSGQFCGQCHGTIAFPPTQCRRCHSVSRYGPQP